jgi:hypothetical protein
LDTFELTQLVIGDKGYTPDAKADENFYWFVVVDLSDLNVVAQAVSTSNTTIPSEIQPYAGKTGFFLYLIANSQISSNIPQGDLYAFLRATGSGALLRRGEQIIEQLGTGSITRFSYILAATLDEKDLPGFETFSTSGYTVLAMQFVPVEIEGKTTYAPVRIGG